MCLNTSDKKESTQQQSNAQQQSSSYQQDNVRCQSAHYQSFIDERRVCIMQAIDDAARRSGRSAESILVEAVSKTVDVEEVICAFKAGWEVFAENRPQELVRKLQALRERDDLPHIRFDMIGNLQKNKINQVLGNAFLIHSISSLHLAEAVSQRAHLKGIRQPVLLEVNVSGEASKAGFSPDEVLACAETLVGLRGLDIRGLMTMAPAHDKDAAQRTFSGLRELRDVMRERTGLPLEELSCGMSDDFIEAIAEGSTIVRLGRVVFSPEYALG